MAQFAQTFVGPFS